MARHGSGDFGKGNPFGWFSFGVIGVLVSFYFIGHGVMTWFRAEEHPDYFTSATCDERLVLDGQEHLGTPCSVVDATLFRHNAEKDEVSLDTKVAKSAMGGTRRIPGIVHGKVDWDDAVADQHMRLQLYDDGTDFVAAKLYDPIAKQTRVADSCPLDRNARGWHSVKLGGIILGVGILWIALGVFMFS